MLLILGPRSSGKTAVLKSFMADKDNVFIMDMRAIDATSPDSFIKGVLASVVQAAPPAAFGDALRQLLSVGTLKAAEILLSSAKISVLISAGDSDNISLGRFKDLSLDFGEILEQVHKAPAGMSSQAVQGDDLNEMYTALQVLLVAWQKAATSNSAGVKPVLIIDECNLLMKWSDHPQHSSKLADILAFLVQICKQDSNCHVVMATADWAYLDWLVQAVGQEFFQAEVIGDFEPKDARSFFSKALVERGVTVEVDDTTWKLVHKVCGGNAGFLLRLAGLMRTHMTTTPPINQPDWHAGLKRVAAVVRWKTQQLACGGNELGWTPLQFAGAALALLESRYHAVLETEMVVLLGELQAIDLDSDEQAGLGRAALRRMVQANALAVRPESIWAKDIADEAFKGGQMVVTATSAVALYSMELMEPELKEQLAKGHAAAKVQLAELRKMVNALASREALLDKHISAAKGFWGFLSKIDLEKLLEREQLLQQEKQRLQARIALVEAFLRRSSA